MSDSFAFDQKYYDRFYRDPNTRVATQQGTDRLADFVCAYRIGFFLPWRDHREPVWVRGAVWSDRRKPKREQPCRQESVE